MNRALWIFSILAAATADSWAADVKAAYLKAIDAQAGAAVLTREQCNACHTIHGQGMGHEPPRGTRAPDLAEHTAAVYRPSALAAAMWNHTPDMWREMAAREATPPSATEAEWRDMFAYLYTLRYAENPAQFSRGKKAFEADCSGCHAMVPSPQGPGKPVADWAKIDDPVRLVWQMWNHASIMSLNSHVASKPWPILTGQDFLDITAWVQLEQKLPQDRHFTLPAPATGREAFAEKCRTCHTGPKALEATVSGQSFMDLGAGMWNHAPLMKVQAIPENEMRSILAWVWELQYTGPGGNAANGQHVFEGAGCVSCHRSPATGAPMRPRGPKEFTPFSMVAVGWGDARRMHQTMVDKGTAWPKLSPDDMNDLVAYLNTLPE